MKSAAGRLLLFVLLLFLAAGVPLSAQSDMRYFDLSSNPDEGVCLTILHPSLGSIRILAQLREKGLLSIENLVVVGLFHEKQRTNYAAAARYAEEHGLDWIKFHKLSGELGRDNVFQENAFTRELRNIFSRSDGILLFGGSDIPPALYKEKTHLLTTVATPFRNFLDLTVVFHLLGGWQDENFRPFLEDVPDLPVLGICLGLQSLNVGTGGTLVQDIWSEIYGKSYLEDIIALPPENWHSNPFIKLYPEENLRTSNLHPIKLLEEGKWIREWGFRETDAPFVYSSHHQALKKLGKGLRVISTSLDGKVIEAVEHEKYPDVLGVQFHPEAFSLWDEGQTSRLNPKTPETTLLSILKEHPPSLDFHKKLWSWFSERLLEYHAKREGS